MSEPGRSDDEPREVISSAARAVTSAVGSTTAAVAVTVVVLSWIVIGAVGGFHEHWHLWGHTGASLITLFMVFFVQHTTNRESRAMLVKLDELLRAQEGAREELVAVEDAELEHQERVEDEVRSHARSAAARS